MPLAVCSRAFAFSAPVRRPKPLRMKPVNALISPFMVFLMSVLNVEITPSRRRPVIISSTSVTSGWILVAVKPGPEKPKL